MTSIPANAALREALATEKLFVPALMIDYVAVADFVLAEHIHLGRQIFAWTRREALLASRRIGVRLIRLDVSVGNWGAYRAYRKGWGMNALPVMTLYGKPLLKNDGTPELVPDPEPAEPPAGLNPDSYIKLWNDIYSSLPNAD